MTISVDSWEEHPNRKRNSDGSESAIKMSQQLSSHTMDRKFGVLEGSSCLGTVRMQDINHIRPTRRQRNISLHELIKARSIRVYFPQKGVELTPIPFMKKQMRFSVSPSRPGTNFVMIPGKSTVRGRKAPKRHARRRSSGNQKPRFFLYLITILSDIQPESGAPTREQKKKIKVGYED